MAPYGKSPYVARRDLHLTWRVFSLLDPSRLSDSDADAVTPIQHSRGYSGRIFMFSNKRNVGFCSLGSHRPSDSDTNLTNPVTHHTSPNTPRTLTHKETRRNFIPTHPRPLRCPSKQIIIMLVSVPLLVLSTGEQFRQRCVRCGPPEVTKELKQAVVF
jgi:hypothetical protein